MDIKKDVALFEGAWGALNGQTAPFAAHRFEKRRAQLTPFQVARLDEPFRRRARFAPIRPVGWPARLFARQPVDDLGSKFTTDQYAALLAMHAPDGKLRERAVQIAPMNDSAALTILLLRCNDWAGPVQTAAFKRLEQVLEGLDQEALKPLCLFVLDRTAQWQRGGAKVRDVLAAHPAWPSAVKAMLMTAVNGPLARSLRQQLRSPDLDWALPELAMGAASSFVRAVATETLLNKEARWPDGNDWVWRDKVFNLRRKVTLYGKRDVTVTDEVWCMVLRTACRDKGAKVRCLVADSLIEHGPSIGAALAGQLRNDKAKSVQERIRYYEKKWGRNTPSSERARQ